MNLPDWSQSLASDFRFQRFRFQLSICVDSKLC